MPEEKLFTTKQAAEYLGVKRETIKYHVYTSKLLSGKLIHPRLRMFTQTELDGLKIFMRNRRNGDPE